MYLQIQPYRKFWKENNPRKLTMLTKTYAIDDPSHFTRTQEKGRTNVFTIPPPPTNLKQTSINNQWSLLSLNINDLNSPIKRHRLTEWIRRQNPSFCCIQETHLSFKLSQDKGLGKDLPIKWTKKQAGEAILISNKLDFKPKIIKRDEDCHLYSSQEKSINKMSRFWTSMPQIQRHPHS